MAQGEVWRPDVTVAVVVEREGRFLLVEEQARGRLVVNQPAGHLDPGETLAQAAVREALEETGWHVELEALVAIYQWTSPHDGLHFVRFTFAARALSHDAARPLDQGIVRALWLSPEELGAGSHEPRSPLVWRCIEDYRAGRRLPLAALASLD